MLGVQRARLVVLRALLHGGARGAAVHPTVAQASKRHYCCLANHRVNPAGGYKVTHEKCSGTSSMAKRRRRVPFEFV